MKKKKSDKKSDKKIKFPYTFDMSPLYGGLSGIKAREDRTALTTIQHNKILEAVVLEQRQKKDLDAAIRWLFQGEQCAQ